MSTAMSTLLRAFDQAFLDETYVWDAEVEGGMVCVTVVDFPLATGLVPAASDLLVRLPAGFPDAGPDMFWFADNVVRSDGAAIPATDLIETYRQRTWHRWSRHIGGLWRPGTDDLRSYFAYIGKCVSAAAA
jgi:hypothetical protein